MMSKCPECDGDIAVPEDVVVGEILVCPDCGLDYEVVEIKQGAVNLRRAETTGEDWGE